MSDARGAASWDLKRATPAEQAAYGEGYDQALEDVWDEPVCSVCGKNHDADESATCEGGEVVSFREWVEAAARLREQLDEARQALDLVDAPYPLDVFPERTPEQRDAIFAAMRAVDPYATEWFYAHVARDRGRVARAALGVEGEANDE